MTKGDKIKNIGYQDPSFGYAILTVTEITRTGWIRAETNEGLERSYLPENEDRTWTKIEKTVEIKAEETFNIGDEG
jgi:hypothetical protein